MQTCKLIALHTFRHSCESFCSKWEKKKQKNKTSRRWNSTSKNEYWKKKKEKKNKGFPGVPSTGSRVGMSAAARIVRINELNLTRLSARWSTVSSLFLILPFFSFSRTHITSHHRHPNDQPWVAVRTKVVMECVLAVGDTSLGTEEHKFNDILKRNALENNGGWKWTDKRTVGCCYERMGEWTL